MTYNEIILALECCNEKKGESCELKCPIFCLSDCRDNLHEAALDLIKRQQAENEKILTELSKIGYCHNFQLERSDIVDYINAVSEVVKKAKNKLEG